MAVFKYKDKSGNFSPIQPYKIINYNTTIENTLNSNSTTSALSAYQGNILNQVKLDKSGGTLTGNINFGHDLGIYWKEDGFGDKFKIVSNFSGFDDENKLRIMGAVGDSGTDPDLYDLMTISGKSGNMWVKGDLTARGNISSSEGILQAKPVVAYSNVSGTTGTIILSVDASNYKNMRVSYFFDTNEYASNDFSSIEKVNGYYCLSSAKSAGNMEYNYIHTCLINVNAKTITLSRNRTLGLSISDNDIYTPGGDNNLYITKVELWN